MLRTTKRLLLGAAFVFTLVFSSILFAYGAALGDVWYVDVDVTTSGDGTKWSKAFKTLHEAVYIAIEGDEIWVKEGTYGFSSTLEMMSKADISVVKDTVWACVGIYDPQSRFNIDQFETLTTARGVLDSAIVGNEIWVRLQIPAPHPTINLDKAVSIFGGFAGWESKRHERDWKNNITLLDGQGESLFFVTADPTIDGFTLTNPGSGLPRDSTIYNFESSSPIIRNCRFINENNTYWVAIRSVGASPIITNCVFRKIRYHYGAVANFSYSNATISNCIFDRCVGGDGGGIINSNSSPIIKDCLFYENRSASGGGGMENFGSSPTISGCMFYNNYATDYGGAINSRYGSYSIITNSVFYGNSAGTSAGGAISNGGWGGPAFSTITNCTFYGNSNRYDNPWFRGGAIYNRDIPSTITNCIFWNNRAAIGPQIYDDFDGLSDVTHSDVEGGYPGEGNIDVDPLLVDPENGDFHLQPASPSRDAGDLFAADLPLEDFEGEPRVAGPAPDMGADEFVVHIAIDIKPGSEKNKINLNSNGVVQVAALTTEEFDVADIDPNSCLFSDAEPEGWTLEDIDSDGDLDIVFNCRIQDLNLDESSVKATLEGETTDGDPISGTDSVMIVSQGKSD